MEWEKFIGEVVSVIIIGKNGKEENYVGVLTEITDGFATVVTEENVTIDAIIFRVDKIVSLWIYKQQISKQKKAALRDKYGLGYPSFLKRI